MIIKNDTEREYNVPVGVINSSLISGNGVFNTNARECHFNVLSQQYAVNIIAYEGQILDRSYPMDCPLDQTQGVSSSKAAGDYFNRWTTQLLNCYQ